MLSLVSRPICQLQCAIILGSESQLRIDERFRPTKNSSTEKHDTFSCGIFISLQNVVYLSFCCRCEYNSHSQAHNETGAMRHSIILGDPHEVINLYLTIPMTSAFRLFHKLKLSHLFEKLHSCLQTFLALTPCSSLHYCFSPKLNLARRAQRGSESLLLCTPVSTYASIHDLSAYLARIPNNPRSEVPWYS